MMEFNGPIPKLGYNYHFFDDGKISPSRHYIATVVDIIPFSKIDSIQYEEVLGENEKKAYLEYLAKGGEEGPTLLDIWDNEVHHCDWLYTPETDFIVKCVIPAYDDNPIFFTRTKERNGINGWFSIDTIKGWESGRLDIDSSIFNDAYRDDPLLHNYWVKHRIINYEDIEKLYEVTPDKIEALLGLLDQPKQENNG